jgi:glycosyltransferase involved in cell wall biosynthesis
MAAYTKELTLAEDPKIFANVRAQTGGLTGVQRYMHELCSRLDGRLRAIHPRQPLNGVTGHLWEQTVLPAITNSHLLWSPANTGPLVKTRQVLTVHDLASIDHPEWFDRRFAAWYRTVIPRLARRVIRVITVSEFSKGRLLEVTGIPDSRVVVIPNGVGEGFRPRPVSEIDDVRRKYGIVSKYYVLSVSSLEPRKNLGHLLNAWRQAATRLPQDIWMVIAGAEGKKDIFRRTKVQTIPPRVLFAGFVEDKDLSALYSGALTLVYPSVYEGFGLPALEAMAAGTVPIAANSTSLPEVVGKAGLLVNPLDIEELADAMVRIVENADLRVAMTRRGIERSLRFTWHSAALSTWKVLSEAHAD